MYQVVINDKYYISDVNGTECSTFFTKDWIVEWFETTIQRLEGKFFEYESEAKSIAEQVGGKVIEYVEKKDIEKDVEIEVCKELEKLKKVWGVSE